MTASSSTQTLASLMRAAMEARPVFLLGAGASFSSGVPLAAESVRRIARRVFAERVKGGAVLPEQVKLSEWQLWLQSQPWFIKGEDRLAENFPLVVGHLLQPREYRARILRDLFKPADEIGSGHKHFADLIMKGLVRTVLTTNFDIALPIALHERRAHRPVADAAARLICIPHAGGTAAAFAGWVNAIPANVELVAVQPPGRAERMSEPAHVSMAPLVEEIFRALQPFLELPFVLFGHSLGSWVAFELA